MQVGMAYLYCATVYPTMPEARYTAFAKAVIPYIVRTTHPDNTDLTKGESLTTAKQLKWAVKRYLRFHKCAINVLQVQRGSHKGSCASSYFHREEQHGAYILKV